MEGVSIGHVLKMNLTTSRRFLLYLQEALPVRLKAIHFFNVGTVIDLLLPLIKPFIKKELNDFFHFHSNSTDDVFKYIPREYFPKDYGGTAPSIEDLHESTKKRLLDCKEYFKEQELHVTDESQRLSKPAYINEIFGFDGSFKKLDID